MYGLRKGLEDLMAFLLVCFLSASQTTLKLHSMMQGLLVPLIATATVRETGDCYRPQYSIQGLTHSYPHLLSRGAESVGGVCHWSPGSS